MVRLNFHLEYNTTSPLYSKPYLPAYSFSKHKITAYRHATACCFLKFLCLRNIDKRQIPIMTNARRKNIPPISPGVVFSENTYFNAILASNRPIKIIGKAFVCLTYNSEFLTSYFVVIISTAENTAPMIIVSAMCAHDSLKYGNIYINAPVDIMIGGIIIFFNVNGVLLACLRTKITITPIITAPIDAIIKRSSSIDSRNSIILKPLEVSEERLQPYNNLR